MATTNDKHDKINSNFVTRLSILLTNYVFNTLRPGRNDRHFTDDILKCIFMNGNVWISFKISLKFVPRCPVNSIRTLVRIMAWHRPGDYPLSEPMSVSLLTHIWLLSRLSVVTIHPLWHIWSEAKYAMRVLDGSSLSVKIALCITRSMSRSAVIRSPSDHYWRYRGDVVNRSV